MVITAMRQTGGTKPDNTYWVIGLRVAPLAGMLARKEML